MNRGTFRGFTWQTLGSDATYPTMKTRWFPYKATYTVGMGEIDTLCWMDTSGGDITVTIDTRGMSDGQCIHFAAAGSGTITVNNTPGTTYCAGTPTTRAQYSVMTAMVISMGFDEVIVFGDITV